MKLTIQREDLLKPLQLISGVVEKRQTLPILSNALITIDAQQLSVTATDLEVELISRTALEENCEPGQLTVPARKFIDICRSLTNESKLEITQEKDRLLIRSGRSRFTLATLPATDYPNIEHGESITQFCIKQGDLRQLIQKTSFAMAQQDVRYYLNGMLLDISPATIRAIATDGHRLALSASEAPDIEAPHKIIVPRKGILELMRLLDNDEDIITLTISNNHIRATTPSTTFTSKLIEGPFPDYDDVIPRNGDKTAKIHRESLKQALTRAAILSNEQYHGVVLNFSENTLNIKANNPEKEEAQDEITVDYQGKDIEICFNVNYMLDVLNTISTDDVTVTMSDSESSILVEPNAADGSLYVIMPMRI